MATNCDVTAGVGFLECKDLISGYDAVYLANYGQYGMTMSATASGYLISDLGTLSTVYKFELDHSGNTFNQTFTPSENGTTAISQIFNGVILKKSAQLDYQVIRMSWGRPILFAETRSGDIHTIGLFKGCMVVNSDEIQGNSGDFNGYNLTFTADRERLPTHYLTEGAITALKALVSSNNI